MARQASAVVKVKPKVHAGLLEIVKEDDRSMGEVITELLDRYETERFWAGVKDAYRLVLVISNDWFNEYNRRMVLVVPVTRTHGGLRYQVEIPAGEGGLIADSVFMSEQIRSIDRLRLKGKLGLIDDCTLAAVRRNVTAIISDRVPGA